MKATIDNPIEVNSKTYSTIESELEAWYNKQPFPRLYSNGSPVGFDLFYKNHRIEFDKSPSGFLTVSVKHCEDGNVRYSFTVDCESGKVVE